MSLWLPSHIGDPDQRGTPRPPTWAQKALTSRCKACVIRGHRGHQMLQKWHRWLHVLTPKLIIIMIDDLDNALHTHTGSQNNNIDIPKIKMMKKTLLAHGFVHACVSGVHACDSGVHACDSGMHTPFRLNRRMFLSSCSFFKKMYIYLTQCWPTLHGIANNLTRHKEQ